MNKSTSNSVDAPTHRQIRAFLDDPEVQKIRALHTGRPLLEIAYPREVPHGRILQWLFDPSSEHGLGDKALRALLAAATKAEKIADLETTELRRLSKLSWSGSVVCREYYIKNRRCDLVVANPKHRVIIAIELKTGAKLSTKQLVDYKSGLSKEYKGWTIVPILLDSEGRNHAEASKNQWLSLHFEWLQQFLVSAKRGGDKGSAGFKALSDYTSYLANKSDATEAHHRIIINIAARHSVALSWMKRLSTMNWHDAFCKVSDIGAMKLDSVYLREWERWDEIISYIPCAPFCKVALDQGMKIEYGKKHFYLTHPKWHAHSNNPGIGRWPFCIQLKLSNDNQTIETRSYAVPTQLNTKSLGAFNYFYNISKGSAPAKSRLIEEGSSDTKGWNNMLTDMTSKIDSIFKNPTRVTSSINRSSRVAKATTNNSKKFSE